MSAYLYFDEIGYDLSAFSWGPVICLAFVVFISSAGIIPLSHVCRVENLPTKVLLIDRLTESDKPCFCLQFFREKTTILVFVFSLSTDSTDWIGHLYFHVEYFRIRLCKIISHSHRYYWASRYAHCSYFKIVFSSVLIFAFVWLNVSMFQVV